MSRLQQKKAPKPGSSLNTRHAKYAPRGDSHYLIALTDEVNGEVVVQPWNCVIDLTAVNKADITAAKIKPKGGGADVALTVVELKSMGDPYGIAYIGAPKP